MVERPGSPPAAPAFLPFPPRVPFAMHRVVLPLGALLALIAGAAPPAAAADPAPIPLKLQPRDRVVFVGGTFAERLTMYGTFEAIVSAQAPELEVTFRSIAWPGDTPSLQPRPLNFGDVHDHLERNKADVVFLCFGMGESFDGPAGLPKFESDLRQLIGSLSNKTYNGKAPPKLALIGPIAHEQMGPHSADAAAHNANLKLYSEAMAKVAAELKLPYADLYTPSLIAMKSLAESSEGKRKLTTNGIHPNATGDWLISLALARALGLSVPTVIDLDAKGESSVSVNRTGDLLPPPSPPAGSELPDELKAGGAIHLAVKNLPPGRYVLKLDGVAVTKPLDAKDLAGGVALSETPEHAASDGVRKLVAGKNEQFYYKHRAVNGEYIYGRRKEPFGVVNFPGERTEIDRIVDELDRKIHDASRPQRTRTFSIEPSQDEK